MVHGVRGSFVKVKNGEKIGMTIFFAVLGSREKPKIGTGSSIILGLSSGSWILNN